MATKQTYNRFALALALSLGVITLWMMIPYIRSLFVGLIFGAICYPMHLWISKRIKWPRIAAMTTLAAFIAIILIPLVFIATSLAVQANDVVQSIPHTVDVDFIEREIVNLTGYEIGLRETINSLSTAIATSVLSFSKVFLTRSADFFIKLFVVLFLMYVIFIDGKDIVKNIKKYLPFHTKNQNQILKEMDEVVKAILIGQGAASVIQGIVGGITFALLGMSGAVFWGFMMVILAFLPAVGASLVWGPAVLILLIQGETVAAVILALVGVVIISNIENLLKPIMMKGYTQIHPFVLFIGIFAGLSAFGIIGLFIGPIIISAFLTVVEMCRKDLEA